MQEYKDLKPFATETQLAYLNAIISEGTQAKAAKILGINKRTLERGLKTLRDAAARRGFSPENNLNNPVPDGYIVPKYSINIDADGEVKQKWISAELDKDRHRQMVNESFQALAETLPKIKSSKTPKKLDADLINLFVIADAHVGMLSSGLLSGGENYDTKIAEQVIYDSFTSMVERSPNAETCQINILGDWLHFDGLTAVTSRSGHVLDTDTRFSKLIEVSIRLMRNIITLALQKHKTVHLAIAQGNHDEVSSMWMTAAFAAMYENEDRLVVETSPLPYTCLQFGEVMLFSHHGHLRHKPDQLTAIAAAQFPKVWGNSKYRYVHTGHRHHIQETENSGARVLQHQTLAAKDAYSARAPFYSENGAMAITYHKKFGEVSRITVRPMFEEN